MKMTAHGASVSSVSFRSAHSSGKEVGTNRQRDQPREWGRRCGAPPPGVRGLRPATGRARHSQTLPFPIRLTAKETRMFHAESLVVTTKGRGTYEITRLIQQVVG